MPGPRGVLLGPEGGGVPGPGGSPWSGGVPGPGGVLLGPRGGAWSGGFSLVLGGSPETPPVNRITDTCKNITLATTSLRPVMKMKSQVGSTTSVA